MNNDIQCKLSQGTNVKNKIAHKEIKNQKNQWLNKNIIHIFPSVEIHFSSFLNFLKKKKYFSFYIY